MHLNYLNGMLDFICMGSAELRTTSEKRNNTKWKIFANNVTITHSIGFIVRPPNNWTSRDLLKRTFKSGLYTKYIFHI